MYTFIHHEDSTVYIQSTCKTDKNYYYRQTRQEYVDGLYYKRKNFIMKSRYLFMLIMHKPST